MNILDGKKTIIGAAFMAAAFAATTVEPLLGPQVLLISKAVIGGIGVFLTGIGVAHKLDKMKNG